MICVTGLEKETAALEARLTKYSGSLQEVRLDALETLDDSLFSLIKSRNNLILTCRTNAEGGHFSGSLHELQSVLNRALGTNPSYIDVEVSVPDKIRETLFAKRGNTKLIASRHRFAKTADIASDLYELGDAPADILKLAVAVEDTVDLIPLLDLPAPDERPLLRIGMGDAGLMTRAVYRTFGSPWTYVAAEVESTSAPGQLTAERAQRWRIGQIENPSLLVLIGGPQVIRSPGADIYNALFLDEGVNALYLPLITKHTEVALRLVERCNGLGASITMPAKLEAALLCSRLSEDAQTSGAVNTVRFNSGEWSGNNTDVHALRILLGDSPGRTLILGAGGVARAVLAIVGNMGTVAARNKKAAEALASEFGAKAVAWEERGNLPFDSLVQCTPIGSNDEESPLPEGVDLSGKRVIDAVMLPGGTPLVNRARKAGAWVSGGFEMWSMQGARQMSLFLGKTFDEADIRSRLKPLLGGNPDG